MKTALFIAYSLILSLCWTTCWNVYQIRQDTKSSEYKYLDLPEEFNQIQSGDTINVYTIGDTTFIRFIPPNTICNNKTIIKI